MSIDRERDREREREKEGEREAERERERPYGCRQHLQVKTLVTAPRTDTQICTYIGYIHIYVNMNVHHQREKRKYIRI